MTNPNKTFWWLVQTFWGVWGDLRDILLITSEYPKSWQQPCWYWAQLFNVSIYIETLFYTKITQRIFKHLFNDTNSRLDSNFNTLRKNWRKTYVICQWHCCDGSPWSLPRLDKSKQSPHSFVQQLLHFSFFHSLEYAKATRWLFSNVFVQLFSQTD